MTDQWTRLDVDELPFPMGTDLNSEHHSLYVRNCIGITLVPGKALGQEGEVQM